jgi:hypothetical protein
VHYQFPFSAPSKRGKGGRDIHPSIVAGVVQVLRERGFDLQQTTHALEGAFLPARVALQRGEQLGRVDDVDLGRVGRFGLRAGFWEEEGESVEGRGYFARTEVFEVLAVVVEDEEEWAGSRH